MKRKSLIPLTVAITLLCASVGSAMAHGGAHGAAKPKTTKPFEVSFLEDMIDHHLGAIETAKRCQERATHDSLKSMCADMSRSQADEVATMRQWLRDWYGLTYRGKASTMKDASLKGITGARFEITFLERMVDHHTTAIQMAKRCNVKAAHDALKDRCRTMIEMRTGEIEEMRGWLCEWYEKCRSASRSSADSVGSYTCPMHSEVVQDKPGSCPKCGMVLERQTKKQSQ